MRQGRPSRTAFQIAATVIYCALDPRIEPLLPPGAAGLSEELLRATGRLKPRHMRLLKNARYRRFVAGMERGTADGQTLNVVLRKRFIEDETRAAIVAGASQVLVVGAGHDTLALRLASLFPKVDFFEIDHLATQRQKLEAMAKLEGPSAELTNLPNLHFIGVDLASEKLGDVLEGYDAWRSEARSVVIAEGLLMYLERSAVIDFFSTAKEHTGTGSRLIFTFLRLDERGRIYIGKKGFLRGFFRIAGEPLLWGVEGEDELEELLARHGWNLDPAEKRDLRALYLDPAGLSELPSGGIEFMAAADNGECNASLRRPAGLPSQCGGKPPD